jgi:hypothetical protein
MSATWSDVALTCASSASPVGAIVMGILYWRQNNRRKKIENDALELQNQKAKGQIEIEGKKADIEIELDAETKSRLVQEAASVNEERERRREEWWAEQLGLVRGEIAAERSLSNKRFRRLNNLEIWATKHVVWDRKAWNKIEELGGTIEAPPDLPEDAEIWGVPNGAG